MEVAVHIVDYQVQKHIKNVEKIFKANKLKGKLETMARISMIICDLCKEEIKEDDMVFTIVLSSCDNKDKSGEICHNCHRSLANRLNKSPADLLKTPQMALTFPNRPINLQRPTHVLDCIAIEVDATGQKIGKSAAVEFSKARINSKTAKQLSDGEFKVESVAHMILREPPPKCNHDKKSFGDDGKFICLLCDEVLGAV